MKRVFVIEDDVHNAVLFRKLLEKRGGCEVIVSEDPAELFAAALAGEIQLVVLDVSLSHSKHDGKAVNGVDLCRRLKGDPRTAGIPVLLATAHAMQGDEQQLLARSGADAYVSKPIVDHQRFVTRAIGLMEDAA